MLFVAGAVTGVWYDRTTRPTTVLPGVRSPHIMEGDERARFALLVSQPGQPTVADMTEWARGMYEEDHLVWAARFYPEHAARVGAPDPCPAGDPISVLFMVVADDSAEARALAERAPLLDRGLSVEVLPTRAPDG